MFWRKKIMTTTRMIEHVFQSVRKNNPEFHSISGLPLAPSGDIAADSLHARFAEACVNYIDVKYGEAEPCTPEWWVRDPAALIFRESLRVLTPAA